MPEEFEQESTYQSAETVPNEAPIQQESTQEETPATTQDEFDVIKYNSEEVKIPVSERQTYLQKGYNYDKVNQRVTEYEQQLNRVAQLSGYNTHDELLSALDDIEQQQQRAQYEEAGIDPDIMNQFIEKHPDIQYARELKQKEEETQRFNNEANELFQAFPDLKPENIPPEAFQLQKQMELQNKHIPLLDAYLRTSYKSLGQQKEQEAIQKLQGNANATPGALGAGAEHNTSYSAMSATDKKALRERVLRGENIQL
jgi:hypothetical protein